MPTRRGWGVAAGTVALAAAGRILGIFELFVLATGAAALLVMGAVTVLRRRVDLEASRSVRPTRIHGGADSRVELVVANRSDRSSPVLVVRDTFAPTRTQGSDTGAARRQARFLLAPLGPGREDRAVYRLPAARRGRDSARAHAARAAAAAPARCSAGAWSRRSR